MTKQKPETEKTLEKPISQVMFKLYWNRIHENQLTEKDSKKVATAIQYHIRELCISTQKRCYRSFDYVASTVKQRFCAGNPCKPDRSLQLQENFGVTTRHLFVSVLKVMPLLCGPRGGVDPK